MACSYISLYVSDLSICGILGLCEPSPCIWRDICLTQGTIWHNDIVTLAVTITIFCFEPIYTKKEVTHRWERDVRSLKEPSGTLEMSLPWRVLKQKTQVSKWSHWTQHTHPAQPRIFMVPRAPQLVILVATAIAVGPWTRLSTAAAGGVEGLRAWGGRECTFKLYKPGRESETRNQFFLVVEYR